MAVEPLGTDFEREKWQFDKQVREREIAIREREQATKESDLLIRQKEHAASRWRNPLTVAVFAAAVAAAGNAVVAYVNGQGQTKLELNKSEQARIFEMIKTGDPDKAAANLSFLLDAGLITDGALRSDLSKYLRDREPGTGAALSTVIIARDFPDLVSIFEGTPVAEVELDSSRDAVRRLVRVKLTKGQEDALVSFVYSIGVPAFQRSQVLQAVNESRYEDVPNELRKFVTVNGLTLRALVARREAEIAMWRAK